MVNNTIRVELIDPQQMFMESLSSWLDHQPDLHVVGMATSTDEGLQLAFERNPDLVIMEVEFPGRGAFDMAAELLSRRKETRLLFLTGFVSDIFVSQALRLQTKGYLLKNEPVEELVNAIRKVIRGTYVFSADIQKRVKYDEETRKYSLKSETDLGKLTNRQIEVLRHLSQGHTVKEVARSMHLSEKSIESHKYRIMNKLGVHDRVALARLAIREGLTLP